MVQPYKLIGRSSLYYGGGLLDMSSGWSDTTGRSIFWVGGFGSAGSGILVIV